MTGKELRRIREKMGLTQVEFAREFGYKRKATISEFENGKKPIPASLEKHVRRAVLLANHKRYK